ncbi:MAG TPA: hypothetical protein VHE34_06215 [Puia sp.]|uniref:hypothetical protein n=1 Tax=Puia sp. TaxID=2045100 RepID=UPI002C16FD05|nr:hypothetical protein [Puia sp.]HVU94798.1 hypothetical protein [Puia sp.]
MKKYTGIELLKRNLDQVDAKFIGFFEKQQPRWPSEKRDYLRNHHQNPDQFNPATITWEKLKMDRLPDDILQEARAAFAAFERGEEYPTPE